MLKDKELNELVEWFVTARYFHKILSEWSAENSTTTSTARVAQYLRNDKMAKEISIVILKDVTQHSEESWDYTVQQNTLEQWKTIASYNGPPRYGSYSKYQEQWNAKTPEQLLQDAHANLVYTVKKYLTDIRDCGADTRTACEKMISCNTGFVFSQDRWNTFVENNKKKNALEIVRLEQESKDRKLQDVENMRQKFQEMKTLPLQDLIMKCTDGLETVKGDDPSLNIFNVMNEFKQAVLVLSKEEIDAFSMLIQTTYRKIREVQKQTNIPDDDLRLQLANGILSLVLDHVQQQRRILQAKAEPAPEPAQPDATPAAPKPFSVLHPSTWGWGHRARASQALPSAQCRVACLLKELDECR